MISLDKRLSAVYDLVRPGTRVADVGTDHGYLICRLLKDNKITHGYACDINKGPLDNARETARENGIESNIEFVLCDGLKDLDKNQADDIVIAGMGGELISRILDNAPWVSEKHLILQPMTKADTLRRYLYRNGFYIEKETAIKDGKHHYTVMSVYFSGEKKEIDQIFAQIGSLDAREEDAKAYILNRAEVLKKRADGVAKKQPIEAQKLYEICDKIKEYAENENI